MFSTDGCHSGLLDTGVEVLLPNVKNAKAVVAPIVSPDVKEGHKSEGSQKIVTTQKLHLLFCPALLDLLDLTKHLFNAIQIHQRRQNPKRL